MRRFLFLAALAVSATAANVAMSNAIAGAYLAGRQAAQQNDFVAAAHYFSRALTADPTNNDLLEDVVSSRVLLGDIAGAIPLATQLEGAGQRSQIAHMVAVTRDAQAGDFQAILSRDLNTGGIGPLVDGLVQAWAAMGTGDHRASFAAFDAVAQTQGLGSFAMYHKAMALASTGDWEGAEGILGSESGGAMTRTRRAAMARAEILSQMGRNEDAISSLRMAFGNVLDPELAEMVALLEEGVKVPFTHITSARDGLAEVFFSVASALRNEAGADYALLYSRLAQNLRPDHIDALLLNAELLEDLRQYDLAIAVYAEVPARHPAFHAAELGRVEALRSAERPEEAISVLQDLAKTFSDLPIVFYTLGDLRRSQRDFEGAIPAYDTALSLTGQDGRNAWFLHYARAICYERLGRWPQAEADFRRALELSPDQPQVLNYLGYSLVEKQIKLDEALDMIERAAAASPESGYIIDSLGWVLYRLGRYAEAVVHMERAVELMPIDPVVNDHLGDVYWAVGRKREARFQWRRALSFVDFDNASGEANPDRMRRKLDLGLDQVLAEEGAPPLRLGSADEG